MSATFSAPGFVFKDGFSELELLGWTDGMNILKELTTFFKISSHKERRTARSLPHHAADATLTSVALTSTTASLLFCFGLL